MLLNSLVGSFAFEYHKYELRWSVGVHGPPDFLEIVLDPVSTAESFDHGPADGHPDAGRFVPENLKSGVLQISSLAQCSVDRQIILLFTYP